MGARGGFSWGPCHDAVEGMPVMMPLTPVAVSRHATLLVSRSRGGFWDEVLTRRERVVFSG